MREGVVVSFWWLLGNKDCLFFKVAGSSSVDGGQVVGNVSYASNENGPFPYYFLLLDMCCP